jgi:hypothetical protein
MVEEWIGFDFLYPVTVNRIRAFVEPFGNTLESGFMAKYFFEVL